MALASEGFDVLASNTRQVFSSAIMLGRLIHIELETTSAAKAGVRVRGFGGTA
jgi:hypothetical protein